MDNPASLCQPQSFQQFYDEGKLLKNGPIHLLVDTILEDES
jgi:hypothetical protein